MPYGYTGNVQHDYAGRSNSPVPNGFYERPKKRLRYSGEFLTDAGWNIQESALAGLDSLDADLSAQIANGGLTPEMEREFSVAQGRVADQVARDRRGWGADLVQASRRSGGTVDPNTALAYQIEREGQLDEAALSANNDIAFQRAAARMQRTDALYQTILAIRERKLGSGEQTVSSGLSARANALGIPRDTQGQGARNMEYVKMALDAVKSFYTGGVG